MKKIVKIQSIADIITNSSSEVFIMEHSLARSLENDYNSECITVNEISYDELLQNSWNYEIYTELLVKLGIVTWAECNYNSNWRAYTENRENERRDFMKKILPLALTVFFVVSLTACMQNGSQQPSKMQMHRVQETRV